MVSTRHLLNAPLNTAILDDFPLAVYVTDAAGYLSYFNEAAVALWLRRPTLGQERWCGSLSGYRPDGTPLDKELYPMAHALRGEVCETPFRYVGRPDGTRVLCRAEVTLLRDPEGNILGAVNVLIDLTLLDEGDRRSNEGVQAATSEVTDNPLARLSMRERQVFEGVVAGQSTKTIARCLGISPRTVEVHRRKVVSKLDVRSVAEMVRLSLRLRQ